MIVFKNLTRVQKTKWAKQVKELHDYTCVVCGKTDKSKNMHAHHVIPKYECPEEYENALENGVALCQKCHRRMHSVYGRIPDFPDVKIMQNKIYDCVENSEIISCGIKPAEPKKFEELAAQQGTTASALIKAYVLQCLGKDQTAEPVPPERGSEEE